MTYFTLGTLIGSGIAVILAISTILSGWVLTILWAWFVVPLGIAQIGIAHGIGICATGRLMIGSRAGSQSDADKTKDPIERLTQSIGVLLGYPLILLLIGWLAQMFM